MLKRIWIFGTLALTLCACTRDYRAESRVLITSLPGRVDGQVVVDVNAVRDEAKRVLVSSNLLSQVLEELELTELTIQALRKTIEVYETKGTSILTIAVAMKNPHEATAIANLLAKQLRQHFLVDVEEVKKNTLVRSAQDLRSRQARIDAAERTLMQIQRQLQVQPGAPLDHLSAADRQRYEEAAEDFHSAKETFETVREEIVDESVKGIPVSRIQIIDLADPP